MTLRNQNHGIGPDAIIRFGEKIRLTTYSSYFGLLSVKHRVSYSIGSILDERVIFLEKGVCFPNTDRNFLSEVHPTKKRLLLKSSIGVVGVKQVCQAVLTLTPKRKQSSTVCMVVKCTSFNFIIDRCRATTDKSDRGTVCLSSVVVRFGDNSINASCFCVDLFHFELDSIEKR